MLVDNLLILRGDGTSSAIDNTEAGHDSVTRDGDTGRAVIAVNKTAKKGIPVGAILNLTTGDRVWTITIEACDLEDFSSGNEVVATFPSVVSSGSDDFMVRRVHTQKKYLRSVVTQSVADNSGGCDPFIFLGIGLMAT